MLLLLLSGFTQAISISFQFRLFRGFLPKLVLFFMNNLLEGKNIIWFTSLVFHIENIHKLFAELPLLNFDNTPFCREICISPNKFIAKLSAQIEYIFMRCFVSIDWCDERAFGTPIRHSKV